MGQLGEVSGTPEPTRCFKLSNSSQMAAWGVGYGGLDGIRLSGLPGSGLDARYDTLMMRFGHFHANVAGQWAGGHFLTN